MQEKKDRWPWRRARAVTHVGPVEVDVAVLWPRETLDSGTGSNVEADKRRWRWALEAAAAGGGEQAGGGAGHWRPRPRVEASKRAGAQGTGGRGRGWRRASRRGGLGFHGDGPRTNWQMGLTRRMCLSSIFFKVKLVPHCPPVGVETCLYVFLCA
jgi:hypothetical protein